MCLPIPSHGVAPPPAMLCTLARTVFLGTPSSGVLNITSPSQGRNLLWKYVTAAPLSRKESAPVLHSLAWNTAPLRAGLASVHLPCLLSQGRNALVQSQGQKFSHFIFFSLSLSALPSPFPVHLLKVFLTGRWSATAFKAPIPSLGPHFSPFHMK